MAKDQGVTPTKRAALAAALLVPVLSAVGACNASVSTGSGYDADAVAKQVQKAQQDATPDLEVTDATCPGDADLEKGATIDCSVAIDGVKAPYTVTVTSVEDGHAKFEIAPAQAIVSVAKTVEIIQAQMEKQGLAGVTVDCGGVAVVVQDPQTSFTCTLTKGDQSQDVTVAIEDLDGNVTITS
ncbi:MAG: hypothetical protein JWN91_1991 [Nocardioides sp.]|nr:hypothetical protein [Nocardioides sp.]